MTIDRTVNGETFNILVETGDDGITRVAGCNYTAENGAVVFKEGQHIRLTATERAQANDQADAMTRCLGYRHDHSHHKQRNLFIK